MTRRSVPTSAEHAAALDRARARYTKGTTSTDRDRYGRARTGRMIVFADGCESWIHYPDGNAGPDPDDDLARLVADDRVGDLWDGAHIATYARPDGPGGATFDVELGIALPSYRDCPAHCEGGTARTSPRSEP